MKHSINLLIGTLLLCLQLPLCIFGTEVVCSMITPSQNLAESRLKKTVKLTNGPDIYPTVAGLLDQTDVVERKVPFMGSDWASLIWMGDPAADSQSFTVDFAPGTTLLKVLQEIAKRRSERVTQSTNFTAITSAAKPGMLATYRQGGDKSELSGTLTAVIRVPVTVREPDAETLEKFINYQLHGTWSLSEKKVGSSYTFSLSDSAKQRVGKINFIGQWVYSELFDALGFVADLRWKFDGKTVKFEEP